MEAARSLGMTYIQSMRYVVLPQAIRVILPPVGNDFISHLKDSSLVSVVAVADMTRRGRDFMAANFNSCRNLGNGRFVVSGDDSVYCRIVNWIERKTRLEK
jgi:polar amino acid transport system permease protein